MDINVQSVATLIGVVTGTAALSLSILNFLRDRAALHVDVRLNMLVKNQNQYDETKDHAVITVTNIGRRPAFISIVGLLFPDGTNCILSDIFYNPKQAKEGEAPCQFLCEQDMLENFNSIWPGVFCFVRTSTGQQYRSKFLSDIPKGGVKVNWITKQKLKLQTLWRHRWALKRRFRV
jgi:hypothetical protein